MKRTAKTAQMQHNTIKSSVTRAWSAGGPNLRRGKSLGGEDGKMGLRESTGKIICLKVLKGQMMSRCKFREGVSFILKVLHN